MLELIKNRIIRKKINKKSFIENFLNDPNHEWILENKYTKRSIIALLESLTEEHIDFFSKHPTYFIPCQAHLSCAIGKTQNHHLILVFPELIQLLKSANAPEAMAILAHEMGHIYYQHTEQKTETLKAQIEADYFAFSLGFGEELQEVLLNHASSVDCRVRIAKLTSYLISSKQ